MALQPIVLQLREEAGVAIDLSTCGTTRKGVVYVPKMPEYDLQTVSKTGTSGEEVTRIEYRNVTESVELVLGNDADNMLFSLDKVVEGFDIAHRRQRLRRGNRMFLEYRPEGRDAIGDTVRSEILSGRVEFLNEPLSPPFMGQLWTVLLVWTRRYYWERLTTVEAALTNSTGTDVTGGIAVWNHHDPAVAGKDNYVYLTLTTLQGTLPTPARIEMRNDTTGTPRTQAIYISQNLNSTVSGVEANSLEWILEAEDASRGAQATALTVAHDNDASGDIQHLAYDSGSTEFTVGETITGATSAATGIVTHYTLVSGTWGGGDAAGSVYLRKVTGTFQDNELLDGSAHGTPGGSNMATADSVATGAGGGWVKFDWTGTADSELAKWTLDTAFLNKTAGNHFRILGAFWSSPSGTGDGQIRFKVNIGGTPVVETDWVLVDSALQLQELATVQLSPQDTPDNHGELVLTLEAKRSAAGSHRFDIDFIQLSPLDGWRVLDSPAYHLSYLETLIDDGDAGQTYNNNTTTGNYQNFVWRGDPIMIEPKRNQILYFLQRSVGGLYEIDRKLTVEVHYRPRSLLPYIHNPVSEP